MINVNDITPQMVLIAVLLFLVLQSVYTNKPVSIPGLSSSDLKSVEKTVVKQVENIPNPANLF